MHAVPVARPSRPSVRFTPLLHAAIMSSAQTTKSTSPIAAPANARSMPVSRMNETRVEAGVRNAPFWNCSASRANVMATALCPASLAPARSPRLRCREILR